MNDLRSQVAHSANLSLEQQVYVGQHVLSNFRPQLDAVRNKFPNWTEDQQKRWAQNWLSGKVQKALRDELPEQQKLKALGINTAEANTLKTMRRNYIPDEKLQSAGTAAPINIKSAPDVKGTVKPPKATPAKVAEDGNPTR